MNRSTRLFEIIQLLRSARRPLTAEQLASELEVTKRTIYRDVVTLQSMQVPIDGEAGVGYIMRAGFDLPPLMFTAEEIEAIAVGLSLIGRTGDRALEKAAESVTRKITDVLPVDTQAGVCSGELFGQSLYTSEYHQIPDPKIDTRIIRQSIRHEEKLSIHYLDQNHRGSSRIILPLAMIYYVNALVVAAWCELRKDFRHFRLDRISECASTEEHFRDRGAKLRQAWRNQHEF